MTPRPPMFTEDVSDGDDDLLPVGAGAAEEAAQELDAEDSLDAEEAALLDAADR